MIKSSPFYPQEQLAAPTARHTQESTVLLAPEQIVSQSPLKIPKNEQNSLIRLTASVKKYGILEPLCVKLSTTENGYPIYVLVDGARRLRAATAAGLSRVPCVVVQPGDTKCLQLEEISAIKHQNLHYFALAERFSYLMQTLHMTQEELARRVGLSQSAIANKLRLLQFSVEERRFLEAANLGERHARALLRIRHPQARWEAMRAIAQQGLNVAQAEAMVATLLGEHAHIKQENGEIAPKTPQNSPKTPIPPQKAHAGEQENDGENAHASSETNNKAAVRQGITPRKFALRDLTPLYNSIERTLSIFKKTGATAEYKKEEDDVAARITIYIPKQG